MTTFRNDAVLLDTDVFSYLNKPGDTRAALYRPHITGKTIALSFVTVGELYTWDRHEAVELQVTLRA